MQTALRTVAVLTLLAFAAPLAAQEQRPTTQRPGPQPADQQQPPTQQPRPPGEPGQTPPGQTQPKPTDQQRPEGRQAEQQKDTREVSAQDREFVRQAAQGNLLEIELGRLAQKNAQHDRVQDFGGRMVKDHGEANKRLESVAKQRGIDLPKELDAEGRKMQERLAKLSGAEFDREYMSLMVKEHGETVARYKKHGTASQDSDVRAYAEKSLPTVQEHLKMAQEIQQELAGKAGPGQQEKPRQPKEPGQQD